MFNRFQNLGLWTVRKGTVCGIAAALMICLASGAAQGQRISLSSLQDQIDALQSLLDAQEARIDELEAENAALQNALDAANDAIASNQTLIADLQVANVSLQDAIVEILTNPVLALAPHLSIVPGELEGLQGPNVLLTGVNLHLRNGMTFTSGINGRGNLVLGYNAIREAGETGTRTGSHNIVIGDLHRYTSAGGLVAGTRNTVNGPGATVTGGFGNIASGIRSSISGGQSNQALGQEAVVSGGGGNVASGLIASVSGGLMNTASGTGASVSGGLERTAFGQHQWVAGGLSQLF